MAADFTGTSGDNSQTGTSAGELFDYSQGGHDTLDGGGGNDEFDFGAAFDLHDSVTGGDGYDTLVLEGDCTMNLTATSFTGIEDLKLMGADKFYHLNLVEENVGAQLAVEVYSPAIIDGSAVTAGVLNFTAHSAAPVTLIGGAGGDGFLLEQDPDHQSIFDGGAGFDVLTIQSAIKMHAADHSFQNIEQLQFDNGADFKFADGNVAAGETMSVFRTGLTPGAVRLDGHKELDGHFIMRGGDQDDTLTGGHQDDTLRGGGGDDRLRGGQGADRLHGGAGADTFFYNNVGESRAHASDLITVLSNEDTIDFSEMDADRNQGGTQHFTLVDHFSGAAAELTIVYDDKKDITRFMGDVDGDGKADFVIRATGDHTDFTNFDGLAT